MMIPLTYKHEIMMELVDEQATQAVAERLAAYVTAPLIIHLNGNIGAGKTTFVRALLQKLGVEGAIKSPTFSLVESYECKEITIHHFDLYRIHHPDELDYLGFRDYFSSTSICCIEWADQAGTAISAADIIIKLIVKDQGRVITLGSLTERGQNILSCIAGVL